ncbi:MAG TPA: PAS domain S-box protein [Myxococcaceae bacterium]|nr:PAS domain S-box protein [Myxococcaceae bacterium]
MKLASKAPDRPAPASPSVPEPTNVPDPARASILLVDDHPANLLALEAVLETLGQRLVSATSGEEALRRVLQEDFAAILMDVQLPGMSGLEAARLLRQRERSRHTPILFLTGAVVDPAHVLKGYAHGAVDYILKPVDGDVLRSKVSVFVELFLAKEEVKRQAALLRVKDEALHRGRLHSLLMQAPAAIAITRGPDFVFELANPLYEEVAGRPVTLGKPLREVLPEVMSQPGVVGVLQRVMETGEPFQGQEFPVRLDRRGNGVLEESYFNLTCVAVRDVDGAVTGLLTHAIEVTEQVRARRKVEAMAVELKESEERFRTLAEAIPQLVWTTRPDGFHDYYNRRWYEYTGTQYSDTQGEGWQGPFHPDDLPEANQRWRHSLATGEPYSVEYRCRRYDGEWRWFLGQALPLRNERGQITRWFGTCTDVHAQKQAEEERARALERERAARIDAEEQRALLRLLIEQSGEAIIMADEKGVLRVFNPEAERQHGAPLHRVQAPDWAATYGLYRLDGSPLPLEETPLFRATQGEPIRDAEWQVKRPDGTTRILVGTATPLRRQDGSPAGGVLIARDETERKSAEEEIRRLNASLEVRVQERTAQLEEVNRELESFTYSVSHDLRAPLRHITGFAELLSKRSGGLLDERARGYVRTISEAAQQGGRLVDDLLAFSRMGRAEVRKVVVPLSEVVAEARRELAPEAEGRTVNWKVGPLPSVDADPSLLRMVFQNLLSNALKYTRPRAEAEIEVLAHERSDDTEVIVRDNGVGFDMQYVGKLFGVFQRLHTVEQFEGTGIGLANVRRIISRHGGHTWAESTLGQGASFHFTLPRRTSPRNP